MKIQGQSILRRIKKRIKVSLEIFFLKCREWGQKGRGRTRVYLRTCIGVDRDLEMIPHFLNHYKTLGVRDFLIVLHSKGPDSDRLEKAEEIIKGFNVQTVIDPWITDHFWIDDYRKKIDEIIQSLDGQAWILSAEVDEFQTYPVRLQTVIQYCEDRDFHFVAGEFVDRLPEDYVLKPLKSSPSLWEQCPVQRLITKGICWTDKIVLHRKHVKLDPGNHHVRESDCGIPLQGRRPSFVVKVHHFKWFSSVVEKIYTNTSYPGWEKEREKHLANIKKIFQGVSD